MNGSQCFLRLGLYRPPAGGRGNIFRRSPRTASWANLLPPLRDSRAVSSDRVHSMRFSPQASGAAQDDRPDVFISFWGRKDPGELMMTRNDVVQLTSAEMSP